MSIRRQNHLRMSNTGLDFQDNSEADDEPFLLMNLTKDC